MNKIFWLFSLETQGSWSGSSHPRSSIDKASAAGAKPGDWEIDRRLLKIGERIASGSCGDLWVGLFGFNYFSSSLFFGYSFSYVISSDNLKVPWSLLWSRSCH